VEASITRWLFHCAGFLAQDPEADADRAGDGIPEMAAQGGKPVNLVMLFLVTSSATPSHEILL